MLRLRAARTKLPALTISRKVRAVTMSNSVHVYC
jgi:hypothetical protein